MDDLDLPTRFGVHEGFSFFFWVAPTAQLYLVQAADINIESESSNHACRPN